MVEYVYHIVRKSLMGEELISLNELKLKNLELYNTYAKKYDDHPDRRKLLQRTIPKLDCLWNDVIFLLPLHPYYVYEALHSLNVSVKKDLLFYEIPTERLKNNKNAVFLYQKEKDKGLASEIPNEEVEFIDIKNYPLCATLPADTLTYFTEESKKGVNFGMFVYIPHILSLGSIKVSDVSVVNWNKAPVQKE